MYRQLPPLLRIGQGSLGYVFAGKRTLGYAVGAARLLWEKSPGQSHNFISGCCAVGSAPALGVPWRYPGQVMAKRRKALQHLRLLDFTRLLKVA